MKSGHFKVKSGFVGLTVAMLSMFSTTSAHAVDGCKFLLCIAGNWRNISECRPTVQQVLRDLARGRGIPTCAMGGDGNNASYDWPNESSCPSMYRNYDSDSGYYSGCSYPGRISVYVDNTLWSQVFWDMGGGTTTWYSDTARTNLTTGPGAQPLDDSFANDVTGWNSSHVAQCNSVGGTPVFDPFGAFQTCNVPDYWNR